MKSGTISIIGKHINASYHYVCNIVERGEIKVDYVPSEKLTADPMIKGLSLETSTMPLENMGLTCTA